MGKILTWQQTGLLVVAVLQFCEVITNVVATTRLAKFISCLGVDTAVPDFKSLSPGILGAAKETRGTSVAALARSCRVMNWVMAIARHRGVRSSAATFINSPAARNSGLKCPFVEPVCDPNAIYRTVDGTCNNLAHPLWGSAYIPLARDLPAFYGRGIVHGLPRHDLPRQTGRNNVPLPNARLVSNIVHASSSSIRETSVTMMYTNFGQALSHDLTDTPMEAGTDGAKLNCCHEKLPTQRCATIKIPSSDFFSQYGRKCMNFFRSTEVTDINCRSDSNVPMGRREQLNIATSFIDGTQVYGRDKVELGAIRGEEGLLKTSFGNQCPFQKHPNQKAFEMGVNMLKSGDEKMSESPGLVASIMVWYREHNRIAKKLAQLPNFAFLPDNVRSNKIFEEARKIVIALIQQTVYREYLPVTVGPAAMTKYNLWPLANGYYTGYNASVNPTLVNSFATASMRFGHKSNGLDLSSLNIQRGRDHGLPSYGDFRRSVSLSVPQEWSTHREYGLKDMTPDTVNRFSNVYGSPADIDLWSGGVSEIPVTGGTVGPLFAELLSKQFSRLRDGDRFWYENKFTGFRQDRLAEIRKVSFAKVICNNMPDIETIQPKAFIIPSSGGSNDRVPCSSLPDMNLDLWR
ncbi:thyroid peroxidase-like [Liolophura sinensis]|uniref:thyroid peroxidase-like n=1 Tax=Liolophura sinensis TaxID=3198878 RepID=UPI00315882AF